MHIWDLGDLMQIVESQMKLTMEDEVEIASGPKYL